jgi:hypothetical protein
LIATLLAFQQTPRRGWWRHATSPLVRLYQSLPFLRPKMEFQRITYPRQYFSESLDYKSQRLPRVIAILLLFSGLAYAQASLTTSSPSSQEDAREMLITPDSSLYVKVRLNSAIKMSALKPGDVVEGKLSREVYSGDRELFPAGSPAQLTVDKVEQRRRVPNDHWPWIIKVFTPRYEKYPTFRSVSVALPGGHTIALRVSLISIGNEKSIQAEVGGTKGKTRQAATSASQAQEGSITPLVATPQSKSRSRAAGPTVALEAQLTISEPVPAAPGDSSSGPASLPAPVTLAAGTRAKVILLKEVSASKSRPGDSFQARIVEPVWLNSKVVLPEGSSLEGKVVKSGAPRRLSRAGSLLLAFTRLTLPGGVVVPVVASLTGAELDQRSHTKIDPEGKLTGDRPGKAWMLINIGATAGIAKEMDDGTQLVLEAIVSTATDASSAGIARIVATCASGLFILTRHGRDVVLPKFTEMNIMFNRPVSLSDLKSGSGKRETPTQKMHSTEFRGTLSGRTLEDICRR